MWSGLVVDFSRCTTHRQFGKMCRKKVCHRDEDGMKWVACNPCKRAMRPFLETSPAVPRDCKIHCCNLHAANVLLVLTHVSTGINAGSKKRNAWYRRQHMTEKAEANFLRKGRGDWFSRELSPSSVREKTTYHKSLYAGCIRITHTAST